MRPISLTALRSNLFKIIDEVIETGNPDELIDLKVAKWHETEKL
jgi:hypothetical protein